jgi:translation elongation factor P/translation initiation factor 5A
MKHTQEIDDIVDTIEMVRIELQYAETDQEKYAAMDTLLRLYCALQNKLLKERGAA